jgi:hypothetical protein
MIGPRIINVQKRAESTKKCGVDHRTGSLAPTHGRGHAHSTPPQHMSQDTALKIPRLSYFSNNQDILTYVRVILVTKYVYVTNTYLLRSRPLQ